MRRRPAIAIGVLVLLVLATAMLGATGGGAQGPGGFAALRRFLAAADLDVREGDLPPDGGGTFVLLEDLRDEQEAAALLQWVAGGGALVLADPFSATAGMLGIDPADGSLAGSRRRPACLAPPAVGVGRIAIGGGAVDLDAGPAGVACFPGRGGHPFVVWRAHERGAVLVMGDPSPLTNEYLRAEDNAAFALASVTSPVVFGPAVPAGTGRNSLWGSLPRAARAVIVQIVIAAALFAIARARRLGRPVEEELPSPIPAGELVRATGRLYRSAKAAGHAGELLRRGTAERLGRRLGHQPGTARRDLAATIARATDLELRRVEEALAGHDAGDDRTLLALAEELDTIRQTMEGSHR